MYRDYGNHNLKGKKTCLLSCGCCVICNDKEAILKKLANKEVKEELERNEDPRLAA